MCGTILYKTETSINPLAKGVARGPVFLLMEKFKENCRCVLLNNIQLKLLPPFEQDPHLEIKIKLYLKQELLGGKDSNLVGHS